MTPCHAAGRAVRGGRPGGHPGGCAAADIDADTLERARRGDAGAMERLLRTIRPVLVRVAARRLGASSRDAPESGADLAQDVAQEALLRIATHLRDCHARSPAEFEAWALAVVRRVLLDLWRDPLEVTSPRRTSLDASVDRRDVHASRATAGAEEGALDGRSPGTPAFLSILRACLDALASATPAQRSAIWWRAVLGASWEEVGRALGTTPGGAKRRYQRAQDRLRREVVRRIDEWPEPDRRAARALVAGWRGRPTERRHGPTEKSG